MVGCISQEIDVGNCDLRASFEVGAQPHFHQDSLDLCAGFRYTYPSCVSFPDGFGGLVGLQHNRGSLVRPILNGLQPELLRKLAAMQVS